MKIIFFGTPEFAKEFLSALIAERDLSVVGVVCQPDAPVGRKKIVTSPPTKLLALEHSIPVFQPESLKKSPIDLPEADLYVVVAYGKIIPQEIIDRPRLGTINVHPSLLPKYRGPSPIQSAIASGDHLTGISIMKIDAQMDHGPILAQVPIEICDDETPESLRKKVVQVGTPLLIETIQAYSDGKIEPKPQNDDEATFCKLLTKDDGKVDLNDPAIEVERKIRAYTPWPGVWTMIDDKRVKILKAKLTSGTLKLIEVQPEGKNPMSWVDFKRGQR